MSDASPDWEVVAKPVPPELLPGFPHADPPELSPAVLAGVRIMDRPDVYAALSEWLEQ